MSPDSDPGFDELRRHLHDNVQQLPIVLWSADVDGKFILSEGRGLERLGLKPGQVVGQSVFELYADLPEVMDAIRRTLAGEEFEHETEVGGRVWSTHYAPRRKGDQVTAVCGYSLDVTEQRQMQRQLREVSANLSALLENTSHQIFSFDADQRLIRGNSAWAATSRETLGCAPQAGTKLPGPAIHAGRRGTWEAWFARALAGEHFAVDFAIEAGAEHERAFEVSFNPIVEDGKVVGGTCFLTDILARNRAQQDLLRSREDLRITLNSIGDAVIATDGDGRVRNLNPVAQELTGWSEAAAAGRELGEVFEIVDAVTGALAESPLDRVLRGRVVAAQVSSTVLIARDGTRRRITDSADPIRNQDGDIVGVVVVFRDVTAEQELQERLHRSERMEAVGQLAGGVAHDFNNLLTAILGFAELSRNVRGLPEEVEGALEQIIQASVRASELTSKLLSFSRQGPIRNVRVNLHDVVEEVLQLVQHGVDPRVLIEVDLQSQDPVVEGDPSQLNNAFLNLCVNARDAMPEGGRLRIASRDVTPDEARSLELESGPSVDGARYVELSIADTGVGIEPQVRERIFEPFFTTKGEGQGTGLGLAGVYGCVADHRGEIRVESEPQRGTTFRLLLPVAVGDGDGDGDGEPAPPSVPNPQQRGSGRILVVDDEDLARRFAERVLRELGYEVLSCANGVEAVARFAEQHERISLVLLDLVMPEMSGEDAFHRMREIDVDVPIVLVSGFSQSGVARSILARGACAFLSKPYRIEALGRVVSESLRTRRERA